MGEVAAQMRCIGFGEFNIAHYNFFVKREIEGGKGVVLY